MIGGEGRAESARQPRCTSYPVDATEIGRLADVDRHRWLERPEGRLERSAGRLAQKQRLDGVSTFADQSLDDQPSFGDEQTARPDQIGVRDRPVRVTRGSSGPLMRTTGMGVDQITRA